MPPCDTPPEVQRQFDELWQRLSPEERFVRGLELIRVSRKMFLAGLRARLPQASEKELRQKMIQLLYNLSFA